MRASGLDRIARATFVTHRALSRTVAGWPPLSGAGSSRGVCLALSGPVVLGPVSWARVSGAAISCTRLSLE